MEINKQLFEDVLSGKLKGAFVLRNGSKISLNTLRYNYSGIPGVDPPLVLNQHYYLYTGICFDTSLLLDIVDFIPDNNMKENELKIQIPEGYCIDESKLTFEKIVFKKKDIKPRSWEEYCENFKGQYYYIQDNRDNIATSFTPNGLISAYKNYVPSKELAEAFLAMMQLMSLRQAWIGDWKPDWKNNNDAKYCLVQSENIIRVCNFYITNNALSFPTREMAEDFMNTFKDLLEVAKPLI